MTNKNVIKRYDISGVCFEVIQNGSSFDMKINISSTHVLHLSKVYGKAKTEAECCKQAMQWLNDMGF